MMSFRGVTAVSGSGWRNRPRRDKDFHPPIRKRGDRFYMTAVFYKTNTLDDLMVRTTVFMERESAMDWGY